MDIRNLFHDCLLAMILLNIHNGLCQDDDYEDGPAFGRCPWIRNKLRNGRVRYRYKGRVAKFLCDSGYELAGKRSSTCVRGQWSNPIPVCVARGCSRVPSIANGRVTEMYRGALLVYDCNPGYTLAGDSSIHCDGRRWNASPPVCGVSTPDPETQCDFESPDLCGWTHDLTHDFDWKRNQFATPSGHVGTGPSHDHTFGENKAGYYLYIEASSPRKINDTARLFSPVYPADQSGGCFIFWYHMYGATTGGIRVYLKPESHVFGELLPKWEKFGEQGNQWLRGNITVPVLNENFQIVIEGIRGESYVGDSAIDDVQLTKLDCGSIENLAEITTENTVADSCRGRCRESGTSSSCGCNENCHATENCCNDYLTFCSEGNETVVQNSDEPLPGDYYGKTTSPVTMTITQTESKVTDGQTTSHSSTESQFTSSSLTIALSSISVPIQSSTDSTTSSTHLSTTSPVATSTAETSSFKASPTTLLSRYTTDESRSETSSPVTEVSLTDSYYDRRMSEPKTTQQKVTASTTSSMSPTYTTGTTSQTSKTTRPSTTTRTSTTTSSQPTYIVTTSSVLTASATTPSTTTPVSTSTITSTSRESSTVLSTSPLAISQFESSSQTAATEFSIAPQSSTVLTTSTPRYNLRPRKTTTMTSSETYPNTKNLSSETTAFASFSSTTVSSPKTESPPASSTSKVLTSTSQSRRWFNVTLYSTSTLKSTSKKAITSDLKQSYTTNQYIPESTKFSFRTSKPPPYISSTSSPTASDSYEMIASKTEAPKTSGSTAVVVSVIIIVIICVALGAIYYLRKYRSKRQSKLEDDSEMRFLPESDYMEYSDASALDKILIK